MLVAMTGVGYLLTQTPKPTPIIPIQPVKALLANVVPEPQEKPSEPSKPPQRKMYPALGSATSERVTQAVEFYQKKGITNVGVAYLVGNFAAESGLKPDNHAGDGGIAWGIAQWHPSRRVGLPDTLEGQMEFAWQEIKAYPLRDALYGVNEHLLMVGIKRYEGYSVEGNRFIYARQLLKHL